MIMMFECPASSNGVMGTPVAAAPEPRPTVRHRRSQPGFPVHSAGARGHVRSLN